MTMKELQMTPAPQTVQQTEQKIYDRSICFTCFRDYVDALLGIEQAAGAETAFSAFKILADYCLYGIDPDPANNPWGWAWCLVEQKARNSENNRRRGFRTENTEQTAAVEDYLADHPLASVREVARAVGCSRGKAHKVMRVAVPDITCDAGSSPVDGISCDADTSLYPNPNLNLSRGRGRGQLPPNSVLPPTAAKHLPPLDEHGEGAAE